MDLSKREKEIAIELGIDVIGAVWYFGALLSGGMAGPKEMAAIVLSIIGFAIVASIIATVIVNKQHGDEPLDERDWGIDARAFKVGYYVLTVSCCILAGQIFIDTLDLFAGRHLDIASDPFVLANIVLGMVIFSFIMKASVQLFLYRRASA